ncbi:MAG: transposase [Armatimonadetes bacterium]|nr:transposase [Armatimonadota bacterium]
MQSRIESYLDEGHGSATLKLPGAAKIVQDALLYYHELHYTLHAWVVMPTHVHVLITPFEGRDFRDILRPLKGYCSREIHKHYGGHGAFWQRDFFDRMIRDEEHFGKIVAYIEWNPVKAGLCSDPSRFPYSSANPTAIGRVLAKSAEKRSGR